MDVSALTGGFGDAPVEAARAFRGAMNVMARPGQIEVLAGTVPLALLSVAAGTLILTLCDAETPIYLAGACDAPAVRDWITFHTGAPFAGPEGAIFAVGAWDDLGPLNAYPLGTSEYPDRATTLIVEMDRLEAAGAVLRGPGIKDTALLNLPELAAFQDNARAFPLGLDFFFTCEDRVAALPRAAKVSPGAGAEMCVVVKGGERAIENAHAWLAEERRGDTAVAELSVAQIQEQLSLAVNRVMAEGSFYDPDPTALAIKQARGNLIEAIFLFCAYRTT